MSDRPNPRSDELAAVLDRLERMHRQRREDLDKTLADVDNINELSPSEAYDLGHLKGAEATARHVRSVVNDKITGIYFESREELDDAIQNRYTTDAVVTGVSPELPTDESPPTIKLGYSWVELPDRLREASIDELAGEIELEESETAQDDQQNTSYTVTDVPDDVTHRVVPDLTEQTAVRFGEGFVVDFGAAPTLRMRLKRAAEREVGRSIGPF